MPREDIRLFVADDSEILREHLVGILSDIEGIRIVGQEGDVNKIIEAVELLNPDFVILDIKMKEGNGIAVLESLKMRENPPSVIMFTNYPYLQYRKKCMDVGADYFFYKSTEFEKLIDVIRETVKTYRRKEEKNS